MFGLSRGTLRGSVLTCLMGAALLLARTEPVAATGCNTTKTVGHFTLNYVSVVYPPSGGSTWTYTLTWDGVSPALSHFTFELCCTATVLSSSPPHDEFGYDGSTGLFGLKWEFDDDFPAGVPVTFSFSLAQAYAFESVQFSAKAGSRRNIGSICGPSDECNLAPPAPPQNISCSLVDPCECTFLVTWTNPVTYTSIKVYVDDRFIISLPGSATSHSLTLLPGDHEICLLGKVDTVASVGACCDVRCGDVPALPPTGLQCNIDPMICDPLSIVWENESLYSSLVLRLDGAIVATLPGTAESATIPSPRAGLHEVCLSGTTICGDPVAPVCCTYECDFPPPLPVNNLVCTITDQCTCAVSLTWNNTETDYHSISILVDGSQVASLSGSAVSHLLELPGPGLHSVCVVPVRNGISAMQVCCAVECPDFPVHSPTDLVCNVVLLPACVAEVTWVNDGPYSGLEITLDGVVVATLPGTAQQATIPLTAGSFTLCVRGATVCGEPFIPVCCGVTCPAPPDPITDLTCTLTSVCDCVAQLAWTNGNPDYDHIRIFIDGILHQEITGGFTSLTVTLPSIGVHQICLVPERSTLLGPETCCSVNCPGVPELPPADLSCTPDTFDCSVDLSWTNASEYSSIVVLLDGVPVASLPGSATTHTLAGPLTGSHQVCLVATTICNIVTSQVCCTFNCAITPPDPVTDLTCSITDPCTCAVALTWVNDGPYDALRITVDGVLVATLGGGATSHSLILPSAGLHEICVTPVRFAVFGPATCCTVDCPVTAPIPAVMLACLVNPITCEVTVTWLNPTLFSSLTVSLNGVLVETLPGGSQMTFVTLTLPGVNEICVGGTTICGLPVTPVCCEVTCAKLVPPEPFDLVCALTDICTCAFGMTWQNPQTYDEIRVLVNGVEVASLPGTATSYASSLVGPSTRSVCVIGVVNDVDSVSTCCDVTCPEVPQIAPNALVCNVTSPVPCQASVSWMNHSSYSGIQVQVDGLVVQTLPGTAQSTSVSLPGPGPHQICLVATTICGAVLAPSCCTVNCPGNPDVVTSLTCSLAAECVCEGLLTWLNGDPDYDSIQIYRDGVLVATLAGSATSYPTGELTLGLHEFCVVAVRFGLVSAEVCCEMNCAAPPPPPAPVAVTCVVTAPATCGVQVTWDNPTAYDSIVVLVNGVLAQTLAGSAEQTTLTLPGGPTSYQVCVRGENDCGVSAPACCTVSCQQIFIRGDCNVDGIVNVADAIKITRMLFQGFPVSSCLDACDHNNDGLVDVADVVFLVQYIFLSGALPPAPFPGCGLDSTVDGLSCLNYPVCPGD
ncbi:MAG: dockerin type I repeat-containing protein [Planctomycetota bacterium]